MTIRIMKEMDTKSTDVLENDLRASESSEDRLHEERRDSDERLEASSTTILKGAIHGGRGLSLFGTTKIVLSCGREDCPQGEQGSSTRGEVHITAEGGQSSKGAEQ